RAHSKRSFAKVPGAMSPRRSAAEAEATRATILEETVAAASREGLEGVTIGRLAGDLRMSKAGVIGHFGSKRELQLAAVERAVERYRREIWEPVEDERPGIERLGAVVDAWLDYLDSDVFPGGCFLTAAAAEFDGRPGPVREAIDGALALWCSVLEADAATAIADGDLPTGADPAQIAFELNAIAMVVNQSRQVRGHPEAIARGRRAMNRVIDRHPSRYATQTRRKRSG